MNDDRATVAPRAERQRNPQGKGNRLREELIAAADRLLAAGGDPESLSLRAVAREAGISAPSVYLQFESKNEMVRAVVTEHFTRLRRAIEVGLAKGHDPVSRLLNGCLAYSHFAAAQPGSYHLIFESRRRGWPELPAGDRPGMDAFQLLVDAVADCMRAGEAKPGDPFQIATDVWVALHGMVSLRQRLYAFPWPDADSQVVRMVTELAGIESENVEQEGGIPS